MTCIFVITAFIFTPAAMNEEFITALKVITYGLIVITIIQVLATMGFYIYRYKSKEISADRRHEKRRFFERRNSVRPSRYRERRVTERRHSHT